MRQRHALVAALGVAVLFAAGGGAVGGATQNEYATSATMQNGTNATNVVNTTNAANVANVPMQNDPNATNATRTTIRVSASGAVEGEPDQAILRVAVVANASSAEAVRQGLAENVSRMRRALRDADVGDDRIRTVAFDIRAERDETGVTGYWGVHAFEITLSDTERAGEILDVAVRNGANQVDGVAFTLSEEKRSELRARALRAAMANASADAETIAASANRSVVGVRQVTTTEAGFVPTEAAVETTAADAAARTDVESGPVTVTAEVVVVYEARES